MTESQQLKTAQLIFRHWCERWQILMDPAPAADLVERIKAQLIAQEREIVHAIAVRAEKRKAATS